MKSKLMKNIIYITILFITFGILMTCIYFATINELREYTILEKESEVIIYEMNIIEVTDNIKINVIKNKTNIVNIPITLFKNNNEPVTDVIVYCDDIQVKKNILGLPPVFDDFRPEYDFSSSNVTLYNLPIGMHDIRLEYICYSEDIIKQYNDVTILELRNDTGDIEKTNIDIVLPKESNIVETNNRKVNVNYLGENKYNLDISKRIFDRNIKFKIDKGIINQGITIEEDYIKSELNKEKEENIIYLGVLGIVTIVLFVITMALTKKIKVKEYLRETDSILDPIMAEAIIDGKIGAKELIMSCIVDLISKGKLKNIGNDAIEIVDLKDISDYEKDIVKLIFRGKNKIKFDDIDRVFLNEFIETNKIYELLKVIKRKILNELYINKIYNKAGEIILKTIKILSIFIVGNVFGLINLVIMKRDWSLFSILNINIEIVIILLNLLVLKKICTSIFTKSNNKNSLLEIIIYLIIYFAFVIIIIFTTAKEHIIVYIGCALILIINFIIYRRTKLHVFTKKGKDEYRKVAGLKKYIIDYSLMEQRELDSVIIWDKYLAYSVAFGISNKVSKMFNEKLMEANIIVQTIDEILQM